MRDINELGAACALTCRPPAQVSSKIGVIETLIEKVDKIILGGGMIFTFYKARGLDVGSSLVEEDKIELARSLEVRQHFCMAACMAMHLQAAVVPCTCGQLSLISGGHAELTQEPDASSIAASWA